jgi:two-component system alkaline phosphatase synthesis response regulator PhoP
MMKSNTKESNMSKKILIIEDDRSAARLTEYTLQQAGYEVIIAYDGFEGLRKALGEHPDLVILDIMLPGLDGYEICHRLRQKPETANTPVLVISAKARQDDKDIGLKVGADEYLTKPVDPSEILAKVETLLAGTSKITYGES